MREFIDSELREFLWRKERGFLPLDIAVWSRKRRVFESG
jgi:hypothetical protein